LVWTNATFLVNWRLCSLWLVWLNRLHINFRDKKLGIFVFFHTNGTRIVSCSLDMQSNLSVLKLWPNRKVHIRLSQASVLEWTDQFLQLELLSYFCYFNYRIKWFKIDILILSNWNLLLSSCNLWDGFCSRVSSSDFLLILLGSKARKCQVYEKRISI